jgi:methionyl-tRNA synthetase
MITKNINGVIPHNNGYTKEDETLLKMVYSLPLQTEEFMNTMQIHKYLEAVWHVVGEANAYIDTQAPWKLKKEDPNRMQTVLYVLAETIRCLAIMAQPIVPVGSARILDQLVIGHEARVFENINSEHALKSGITLPSPQGVFPRLELSKEDAA